MSKRELRKVCEDLAKKQGISFDRKQFNADYKPSFDEEKSSGPIKPLALGALGLSFIPISALADDPAPIVEKAKEEKKPIKFLTGTYYQALKGNSSVRFEGGSNDLPLGLETYGLLDLKSDSKKPGVESVSGEFRLSKKMSKELSLSTRSTVMSGAKDITRLGLKYSPRMKNGDMLNVEFYPLETDGKQTVYVYGMKKLKGGKFFVDLLFKGTLDDFQKMEKIYGEIGCGMKVGENFEIVGQGRFASGGYKAILVGGRYSF